jgi:hypothetical protein
MSIKDKQKLLIERLYFKNKMTQNSALMFSIEQWELVRRLRNSGLTKDQIIKAYDDLERVDEEFGTLYNIPNTNTNNNSISNHLPLIKTNNNETTKITSPTAMIGDDVLAKNMQSFQLLMAKNLMAMSRQNQNQNQNNNTITNENVKSINNNINKSTVDSNSDSFSGEIVTKNMNNIDLELEAKEQMEFEK